MLDLAFLAVGIYVFVWANRGVYKEAVCNIALVIGILAGIVGCVAGISRGDGLFVTLNLVVCVLAFVLRFAAKHLVKLYNEKERERLETIEREHRSRMRTNSPEEHVVNNDDNFDDEELRFGKGGYTDPKI